LCAEIIRRFLVSFSFHDEEEIFEKNPPTVIKRIRQSSFAFASTGITSPESKA
jgi:hypothetical protein